MPRMASLGLAATAGTVLVLQGLALLACLASRGKVLAICILARWGFELPSSMPQYSGQAPCLSGRRTDTLLHLRPTRRCRAHAPILRCTVLLDLLP